MSQEYATLEDTLYFYFASNDTSGSGNDGASAAAHVRLAGATASAAPVLSPTPDLLSHASYPPGAYEVAVAATTANGFSAGATYAVFCTLAVDSQNPTGFIGKFILNPVPADVIQIGSGTQSATDLKDFADTGYDPSAHKVQGVVLADTATNLTNAPTNGDLTATMKTSVTTAATAATPTAAAVTGAVGSVTAGVTVTTNNDKTGYALSAAGIQAIWDALTSALTTAGSIGKLIVDYLDTAISSRMATTHIDATAGKVEMGWPWLIPLQP